MFTQGTQANIFADTLKRTFDTLNLHHDKYDEMEDTVDFPIKPHQSMNENHLLKQGGDITDNLMCDSCLFAVGAARTFLDDENRQEILESAIELGCSFKYKMSVCKGMLRYFSKNMFQQLMTYPSDPAYFCSNFMTYCKTPKYKTLNEQVYIDNMIASKPDSIAKDDFIQKLYQDNETPIKTFKIAHLTDLHLDLDYVEGTSTKCDFITCCRLQNGFPDKKSDRAGKYGGYTCDTSLDLITSMGDFLNSEIKPDAIFWTGDTVPHNMWEENDYSEKVKYMKTVTNFFDANFTDTPLYPVMGNHDFHTSNLQNFVNKGKMIDITLDMWKDYLDDEAEASFQNNSYYVQKLRVNRNGTLQTIDKVNVIGLNTQPCYTFNFYVWSQRNDPGGVLAWMNQTLYEMEQNNETAIVIAHIPPADHTCSYAWASRYQAIAERYQHIIRFSTFGHDHRERHNLVRGDKSEKPFGVQYWSSSITTFENNNPSFRVFEVDEATMLPVKVYTYYMNLREKSPQWKLHHEMTEFYNMPDLSPRSFDDLSKKILEQNDVAVQYIKTWSLDGPDGDHLDCNKECRRQQYCQTRSSTAYKARYCMGLKPDMYDVLFNYLAGPWIDESTKNPNYEKVL